MKKTRIKHFALVLSLLIIFTLSACGTKSADNEQAQAPAKDELLQIGTGNSGAAYYYIGSGISEVMNKNVTGVKVTPVATAGGLENLRKLSAKSLDLAIATPEVLDTVIGDGSVKPDQIRLLGNGHMTTLQVVVRKDFPGDSLDQALKKGVKIGIGEPGSSIHQAVKELLTVVGLSLDDVKGLPVSQSEMVDALKDGRIDVACMGGGLPVAGIVDLATSLNGIKILSFSDKNMADLQKLRPYLSKVIIPADTYKGQTTPAATYGYYAMVCIRPDLPEDLVYKLVKAMYDHSADIAKIHPAGKEYIAKNALLGADFYKSKNVMYHAGAIKYLKEQNVWDSKYE